MRLLGIMLIFCAATLHAGEVTERPDLSRELRIAAEAIGSGNGIELEPAAVRMRALLDQTKVRNDPGAALTLLDLTAGPGTEKLRSVAARYAVGLAPDLPEVHLRHAQRLYADGFEAHYWLTALDGYFRALDQPLFVRPLRDAAAVPLRIALSIAALLLLFPLFLRYRQALARRYGIPALAAFFAFLIPWSLAAAALPLSDTPASLLLAALLSAFLLPATPRRDALLLFTAATLSLFGYGLLTALGHLPPAGPEAIDTAGDLLALTAPDSAGRAMAPYLLHDAARTWLLRHGLYALLFGAVLFFAALVISLLLARHGARSCAACGTALEPGENARAEAERCIVCEHIAERPRMLREAELRRYREQAAFRQRREERSRKLLWPVPGAGLLVTGRSWEGALCLYGIAALAAFGAFWDATAPLLALYRPLDGTPTAVALALALTLYIFSVIRLLLAERNA